MAPVLLRLGLSKCYGAITRLRNLCYDRGLLRTVRVDIPIVSIGNITAGGNGKTPLCIALALELIERGYRPVVLSRGYLGSAEGPIRVTPTHDWREVGDEPLMMSHALPAVVVAKRRAEGAQFIEREKLGNIILLDDGLQHRRLERTVDVVSINVGSSSAVSDLLSGNILPLGTLREPRESALSRADLVILSQRAPRATEAPDPRVIKLIPPHCKIFRSYVEPRGFFDLSRTAAELPSTRVIAVCALASPDGFFHTLEAMGLTLLTTKSYPDHHPIDGRELEALRRSYPDAPLVCSEKDAVKFSGSSIPDLYYLGIRARIDPADAFFVQMLRTIVKRSGPSI
jgi:tetraacyldisaccharide 4'-kinase